MIYQYIEVGRFKKPFGTEGEIRLHINDGYEPFVDAAAVLFAEQMGTYVPYFVERMTSRGTVKVEEIDSPEQTAEVSGKTCYLREQDVDMDAIPLVLSEYEALVGLRVLADGVDRGVIEEIVEYPQQMMARLTYAGSNYLIPLAAELITSITPDEIQVDLPTDFWDVFGD